MSRGRVQSRKGRRMANRSRGGDVVNFLFLCAVGVFMALPLVYVIVNAFKPLDEIFMFPPRFFVRNPTMNNFSELYIVLADSWVPFSRYVFNTLFITATGTLFHVLFASMAAFALCKIDLPGKNLLFFIVVNSLMFTPAVTGVPNYMIMTNLRLTDTYWSIILPVVGGSMGLFLMKQFMSTVPDALIEAAKIDGAHQMTIFWRVVDAASQAGLADPGDFLCAEPVECQRRRVYLHGAYENATLCPQPDRGRRHCPHRRCLDGFPDYAGGPCLYVYSHPEQHRGNHGQLGH